MTFAKYTQSIVGDKGLFSEETISPELNPTQGKGILCLHSPPLFELSSRCEGGQLRNSLTITLTRSRLPDVLLSRSLRPHGLQPTGLLYPWDSPGKNTGVVAITFSRGSCQHRDGAHVSYVSCAGRQALYHQPTWAHYKMSDLVVFLQECLFSHTNMNEM